MPAIIRENCNEVRFKKYSVGVEDEFSWNLIKAIYLGARFPELDDHDTFLALLRLNQVIELGIEQLDNAKKEESFNTEILLRVDEMIQAISNICPSIQPIINWFNTERSRIPPGDINTILLSTEERFEQCRDLLNNYIPKKELFEFEGTDLDLV